MKKIYIFIFIFFSTISYSIELDNTISINIDKTENKKNVLMIENIDFVEKKGLNKDNVKKIINIIKNNLSITNIFTVEISNKSIFDKYDEIKFLSNNELTSIVVANYSGSRFDSVMSGYIDVDKDNNIVLKLRLWDILDQREIFKKAYTIDNSNYKRVADKISDLIYESLTGEIDGIFDTKIIFIAESGSVQNRVKKVGIVDFDGSNLHYITNGKNLVLTPVFSKYDKNEIFYLEYKGYKPQLYKLNLKTKQESVIGSSDEMTYAPNFNPNGRNEIAFSASRDGYSNVYTLNFKNKVVKKLTNDKAISTTPTWSPDGEQILYVSDKTGVRKLYIMDKNGEKSKMISKNRGSYDKPSWSPDGKLLSFIKMEGGKFYIGLMTPDGESERIIMSAYLVEGVKWSPNGRYLIYSKQKTPYGKDSIPSIYVMDILTGHEHRIPTSKNIGFTDPDWIKK